LRHFVGLPLYRRGLYRVIVSDVAWHQMTLASVKVFSACDFFC